MSLSIFKKENNENKLFDIKNSNSKIDLEYMNSISNISNFSNQFLNDDHEHTDNTIKDLLKEILEKMNKMNTNKKDKISWMNSEIKYESFYILGNINAILNDYDKEIIQIKENILENNYNQAAEILNNIIKILN